MDKLRIGVIGVGWWSSSVHIPQLRATGQVEIVAISRRDPEKLALAQQALHIPQAFTDWQDLLAQPLDGVIVSTAHHAHTEPTLAALARGIPVLVEKPLALTTADAERMVAAAAQVPLMVGYNARCLGPVRTLHQALPTLGTVRQINIVTSDYYRWFWEAKSLPPAMAQVLKASGVPAGLMGDGSLAGYWRSDPAQMGGGMFVDMGSHWVDLGLWLGGAAPLSVVAFTEQAGLPVDCFVAVQARLANGVLVSWSMGAGVAGKSQRQVTILGDRGVLTGAWSSWDVGAFTLHQGGTQTTLESQFPNLTPAQAFVHLLRGEGPNLCPAEAAAQTVALTQAAYQSAERGQIVNLA